MPSDLTGKAFFVLASAFLLSSAASLLIGWRYRLAVQRHMQRGRSESQPPGHGAAPLSVPAETNQPPLPHYADNARAARRITTVMLGLCLAMAVSTAAIELAFYSEVGITVRRLVVRSIWGLWLVIPVLGVLWRWTRLRIVAGLVAWLLMTAAIALSQSYATQTGSQLIFALLLDIGLPMAGVMMVGLGGVTRAVAPWLLPLFMLLMSASLAGQEWLAWMVEARPERVKDLLVFTGATPLFLLAMFGPWLLALLPARWLARRIVALYRRHWVSELLWLTAMFWFVDLSFRMLGATFQVGAKALLLYLPLAWIPLMFGLGARAWAPGAPAPMLLVLRVFRRDADVQALFDAVIERWRLTGQTTLIAATDLLSRTVDPAEIFAFLGGRISEQFIARESDVAPRLRSLDLRPDREGRYRINECYCQDNTWKAVLDALVARTQVVLTDLRNFKAGNEGCLHELRVLAQAPNLARVVVLYNADTERVVAERAISMSPSGRFTWIDTSALHRKTRDRVLRALFGGNASRIGQE